MQYNSINEASFDLEFRVSATLFITRCSCNSRQREVFNRLSSNTDTTETNTTEAKNKYWNELLAIAKRVLQQEKVIINYWATNSPNNYYKNYEALHLEFIQQLFTREFNNSKMYDNYLAYFSPSTYADNPTLQSLCSVQNNLYSSFSTKYGNTDKYETLRFLYTLRRQNFLGQIQTYLRFDVPNNIRQRYYSYVQHQQDYFYGRLEVVSPSLSILNQNTISDDLDRAQTDLKELESNYFESIKDKQPEDWSDEDYAAYVQYIAKRDSLNHTISQLEEAKKERGIFKNSIEQWKEDIKDKEKWKEKAFEASKEATKVALSEIGCAIGKWIKNDPSDQPDWTEVSNNIFKDVAETAGVALANYLTGGLGGALIEGIFKGAFAKPDPYMKKFSEIENKLNEIEQQIDKVFNKLSDLDNFVRNNLPTEIADVVLGYLSNRKLNERLLKIKNHIDAVQELTYKKDHVNTLTIEDVNKLIDYQSTFISNFQFVIQTGFNMQAKLSELESSYPKNAAANTVFSDLVNEYRVRQKTVGFLYNTGITWFTSQMRSISIKYLFVRQEVIETLACYSFFAPKSNRDNIITTIENLINPIGKDGTRVTSSLIASMMTINKAITQNALNPRMMDFLNGDTDISFRAYKSNPEYYLGGLRTLERRLVFNKFKYYPDKENFRATTWSRWQQEVEFKPILQQTTSDVVDFILLSPGDHTNPKKYDIVYPDDFNWLNARDILLWLSSKNPQIKYTQWDAQKRTFIHLIREDQFFNYYFEVQNNYQQLKIKKVSGTNSTPFEEIFKHDIYINGDPTQFSKEWWEKNLIPKDECCYLAIYAKDPATYLWENDENQKIWCVLEISPSNNPVYSNVLSFGQVDVASKTFSFVRQVKLGGNWLNIDGSQR